jgi:hypothetical protein
MAARYVEHCSRCGREAPPFIAGPEGAAAQGWLTLEGPPELDTYEDPELGGHPVIYGESHAFYGNVCPGCQTAEERAGWTEATGGESPSP